MKKIALAATLAVAGLFIATQASAVTPTPPTANFNVNISTTSGCVLTAAPSDVNFAYTAFAPSDVSSTGGSFTIKCSKTLSYGFTLDGTGSAGTYAYTDAATALDYKLTLPTASAGTGADQTYSITGVMVKDQAGKCAATVAAGATCDNTGGAGKSRTLTITY